MKAPGLQPSAWVQRWAHLIAPGGSVLDVACGSGRHVRWLAARGHQVTALDRNEQALAALQDVAECVQADIEAGPWPWAASHADAQRQFDCVLVTNYLWRPLWPGLLASLNPSGVLIYETFADGQQHIGRPKRPDFLLQAGELLSACAGLRVVAYEDGYEDGYESAFESENGSSADVGRCVQRIAAVRGRSRPPPLSVGAAKHAD